MQLSFPIMIATHSIFHPHFPIKATSMTIILRPFLPSFLHTLSRSIKLTPSLLGCTPFH